MAAIDSQLLFLTTSPRTPEKMIPEIKLLVDHFENQKWGKKTQCEFMEILREKNFFQGKASKDPAFSARDRITRAPKSLGFVVLSPTISLTPAGHALLHSKQQEEVFLRQMLKFQVPSPYHKPTKKAANFCIKPFLEILRLIRTFGTLRFDELQIFGMQLTDWHDFDIIVEKIKQYRVEKTKNEGSYKKLKIQYLNKELLNIYKHRIEKGETKTRESSDKSLNNFLKTQASNMRDYADACYRYLQATGLIAVSHIGKSLSIIPERLEDVDYLLSTVPRNPVFIDDKNKYISYLTDIRIPQLLTDKKDILLNKLKTQFPHIEVSTENTIEQLKDLYSNLLEKRKNNIIENQVKEIKNYHLYDDIQNTFDQLKGKKLLDSSLIFEWNTWRAMTMLDGGDIKANLKFDDYGNPLSVASGNMPDIVCDYDDYMVSVEVTMSNGQKQYEMEAEPVSRHLGKLKKTTNKSCYCLFVAPTINSACVAHFYTLHKINIEYYGGKSVIIPLELDVFRKMLEDSYRADYIPSPNTVREFFEYSKSIAETCDNEIFWYEAIKQKALNWLD